MHLKSQDSEPMRVPDSRDRRHAEPQLSPADASQRGTEQLPNVTSLINRHAFIASLDAETSQHQTITTCHVNAQGIRLSTDDTVQQIGAPDEKYNVGVSDYDKPHDLENRELKKHTDRPDSHANTGKINSSKTIDQAKSEGIPQETSFVPRGMSEEKIGEACSVSQQNFDNHPHTATSVGHIEPLSIAIQQGEKLVGVEGRARGTNQEDDVYDNGVSSWEQENDRFVHYAWRNDAYTQNTFVCDGSGDDGHASTLLKSSGFANSMMIGSHYPQAFLGDGSCSNLGLGHRRRRRRVQTPVQRSAANMRERRRMCHLNVAFDRLKEHLPNIKHKQKLSRIQTLKAAIDYINLLQESLSLC